MRLWPWFLLAACRSDGSLEIRVTAAPELAIKEVQLYVGVHDPQLDMIRPEGGLHDPTVWWKHEANGLDVEPMVEGGVVYQFWTGKQSGVSSLIAVGFRASVDGSTLEPVAVATHLDRLEIPDNEIHEYRLELVEATPLPRRDSSDPSKPGLRVWGPPADPTRERPAEPRKCVQVDNVEYLDKSEYMPAKSGMIISHDDIDCDGLIPTEDPQDPTNRECFADQYLAQKALPFDSLTCALTHSLASTGVNLEACVAGGATCADGTGADPGVCSPSGYCVQTQLCACATRPCDPYRDPALHGASYLRCVLPVSDVGGSYAHCSPSQTFLDLNALLPELDLDCDQAHGPMLRRFRQGQFNNPLPVVIANQGSTFVGIAPKPSGTSCQFYVSATGLVPVDASGGVNVEHQATLAVPLKGPVAGRGIFMPIEFRFEPVNDPDCPTFSTGFPICTLVGPTPDTVMTACVHAPVAADQKVTY